MEKTLPIKLPPASYTFHKAWEQCPRKAWHTYIAKDVRGEETQALRWGNEVHSALETYLRSRIPLPASMEHFASLYAFPDDYDVHVEIMLGIREDGSPCRFFDDDVWCRGKLDVVVVTPSRGDMAMIVDHKTGKLREDPYELMLHATLLKAHWPQLTTIKGWYVWLKDLKLGQVHDLSDTAAVLGGVRWTRNKIAQAHALGATAFPPKQSPLCAWCSVKTCEFNPHR